MSQFCSLAFKTSRRPCLNIAVRSFGGLFVLGDSSGSLKERRLIKESLLTMILCGAKFDFRVICRSFLAIDKKDFVIQ